MVLSDDRPDRAGQGEDDAEGDRGHGSMIAPDAIAASTTSENTRTV